MSGDILFLAHRIPFPPDRGDKMRSWHILKFLGTLGRVHLACFADDQADARNIDGLRAAMGDNLGEIHVEVRKRSRPAALARALLEGKPASLTLFDSAAMRRFVDTLLAKGNVQTVFAFSGQMAQFVPDTARQRFVMDFVDVDSAKFGDYARGKGAKAWLYRREADKLAAFERATAARADVSLLVSEAEAARFSAGASCAATVRSVRNGIDLDFYNPDALFPRRASAQGPLLVFTGQMDYRPNVEAVAAFAERSWPAIRAQHPDACFAIVGRDPVRAVRRLAAQAGVIVTGTVPDVRAWLAAADIVVAPLGIARGVQNKVLEAMAMARPVVASGSAFEGIDAAPGRDLIVANAPTEAILALLADPERAEAIGRAARRRMEKGYRWDATLAPLADMLDACRREAAE